ncbi:MAG: conjugative transposon protein TraN [Prolixibacteraceae bacterium]|nr:conjugative transposon protein TraN [Prolixibacteraceae bacterium]
MKKISAVLITGIFLFLASISAFSQNANPVNTTSIEPYPLSIAYEKTTNLVFPYTIKSVDRGSQSVLAQKAKGVENILQIKAGRKGFEETNLTVITAEGKLYCFLLNYAPQPSVLNLSFGTTKPFAQDAFFSPESHNEGEIQAYSNAVAVEKKKVHGIKDKKYGMKFRLDGLFIHDNVMYYRIKMENRSNINYDIDQLRFFIRDRKKAKRTATQEIEIKPLYVQNETPTVRGQSEHIFVFALPKFTIPDQKYLAVQLMEKNGGRHLKLDVHNKALVRSTVLPSL